MEPSNLRTLVRLAELALLTLDLEALCQKKSKQLLGFVWTNCRRPPLKMKPDETMVEVYLVNSKLQTYLLLLHTVPDI